MMRQRFTKFQKMLGRSLESTRGMVIVINVNSSDSQSINVASDFILVLCSASVAS